MFEELIGNENVKQILQKTITSNHILHSYLFVGPSGIGKMRFAKEFAKMILCQNEKKEDCKCKSCLEFDSENHPDFSIIQAEGTIKIEQIRIFQKKVLEKPVLSERKVYIIEEADTMTKEAQNCLLKTLEEPPEFVTMILLSSNESQLLPTILSRCTKMVFEPIKKEILKPFLERHFEMTDISEMMLETFHGSIGKALELKEKGNLLKQIQELIYQIDRENELTVFNKAEVLYQNKEDIFFLLDTMNVTLYHLAKENPEHSQKYIQNIQMVEDTKKRLKANSNYDMCIDHLLLHIGREQN